VSFLVLLLYTCLFIFYSPSGGVMGSKHDGGAMGGTATAATQPMAAT